jgi:hypothetical protein
MTVRLICSCVRFARPPLVSARIFANLSCSQGMFRIYTLGQLNLLLRTVPPTRACRRNRSGSPCCCVSWKGRANTTAVTHLLTLFWMPNDRAHARGAFRVGASVSIGC